MKYWDISTACDRAYERSTVTRLPSASTSLIFVVLPGGGSRLVVMGPRTKAMYFPYKDIPYTVNAQFRPGWARALTGVQVSELTDRVVALGDLWGRAGERLHEQLEAAPHNAVENIERALADRVADPYGRLVQEAAHLLPQERVQDTAQRLNISERHLRTLFTGAVGLSPKRFVQVNRVRNVISHARSHKGAKLAAESGYYDQSHMTAEFRATMGVPLGAYLAGDLTADATC